MKKKKIIIIIVLFWIVVGYMSFRTKSFESVDNFNAFEAHFDDNSYQSHISILKRDSYYGEAILQNDIYDAKKIFSSLESLKSYQFRRKLSVSCDLENETHYFITLYAKDNAIMRITVIGDRYFYFKDSFGVSSTYTVINRKIDTELLENLFVIDLKWYLESVNILYNVICLK